MDGDAAADEGRTPWWRYALAATLGLSLLGLTYVLFDPELGTPVPLFQEFTCRGRIEVFAGNVRDEPTLLAPQMALKMRTFGPDGEPMLSYLSIYRKDGDGDWQLYIARPSVTDPDLIFLDVIDQTTAIRVNAKDLEGRVCAGESAVITLPRGG